MMYTLRTKLPLSHVTQNHTYLLLLLHTDKILYLNEFTVSYNTKFCYFILAFIFKRLLFPGR